jgi:hypothetical protein
VTTEPALVRLLLGLKVGDGVVVAPVKEVRAKHPHRALASVEREQVTFRDESGFETVRFAEGPSEDGRARPDLAAILNSLDLGHESV